MQLSIGLVPSELRLNPQAFELIALLPRFLKRRHKRMSAAMQAGIKRALTWQSVGVTLSALDIGHTSDLGFTCVHPPVFYLRSHAAAQPSWPVSDRRSR